MGHTGPVNELISVGRISRGQRTIYNYEPVPGSDWYSGGPVYGSVKTHRQRPISRHNPKQGALDWRKPSEYYFYHEGVVSPLCGILSRGNNGWGTEYDASHPSWVSSLTFPETFPPPVWVGNMALIKARNDLRENNSQLGVALLERKKTSDLVISGVETITASIRAFRKAKRNPASLVKEVWRKQGRHPNWYRKLSRNARPVADRWLETQYGWLPTMSDIQGASDALARQESGFDHDEDFLVHSKKSYVDRSYSDKRDSYWPFNGNTNWRLGLRESFKRGATVRLDYAIVNKQLVGLSELGLLNPASIAWEVVPFSFIVDWAWPIGPWLESLDATAGMKFKGGSLTYWAEYKAQTESGYDVRGESRGTVFRTQRPGRKFFKKMQRLVYTSSPVPFPPMPAQGAFLKAGKRGVNALALLGSALGRR